MIGIFENRRMQVVGRAAKSLGFTASIACAASKSVLNQVSMGDGARECLQDMRASQEAQT